jgi:hypothetical protein
MANLASEAERLYKGIGKVVVEFQLVENGVADVLASLLQMRHPTDIHRISAAMSYAQKVNLMCDLYPERSNPSWPPVELRLTRDSLMAAESFRNTVVHSLWHVGGAEPQWIRTKANLRSKGSLSVSSGVSNLDALEEGAGCLYIVRDWYCGQSEQLTKALARLRALVNELSERGEGADAV